MSVSDKLNALLREVSLAHHDAVTYEQRMDAARDAAGKIYSDPDCLEMTALLALSRLTIIGRSPSRSAERNMSAHEKSFPQKKGRYQPQPASSRDDAAELARETFLDSYVAVDSRYGEKVRWRDMTHKLTCIRRDYLQSKLSGLTISLDFVNSRKKQFEAAGIPEDDDTVTLGSLMLG